MRIIIGRGGYHFDADRSAKSEYVFLRTRISGK